MAALHWAEFRRTHPSLSKRTNRSGFLRPPGRPSSITSLPMWGAKRSATKKRPSRPMRSTWPRSADTVTDQDTLFGFELLKAEDSLPSPILIERRGQPIHRAGPGLDLWRVLRFLPGGCYTLGELGYGWTSNWDISATTDLREMLYIQQAVRSPASSNTWAMASIWAPTATRALDANPGELHLLAHRWYRHDVLAGMGSSTTSRTVTVTASRPGTPER